MRPTNLHLMYHLIRDITARKVAKELAKENSIAGRTAKLALEVKSFEEFLARYEEVQNE